MDKSIVKPTAGDIKEWIGLCEYLEKRPRKSSYYSSQITNSHLLGDNAMFLGMRKWMKYNDCDCVFYSTGWGWRLRKNWRERLASIEK